MTYQHLLNIRRIAHFPPDFARQDDTVATAFEGAAEHDFGSARIVDIRGVKKIDAGVHAPLDHADCGGFIRLTAEGHAAEAKAGNFQARGGERC